MQVQRISGEKTRGPVFKELRLRLVFHFLFLLFHFFLVFSFAIFFTDAVLFQIFFQLTLWKVPEDNGTLDIDD